MQQNLAHPHVTHLNLALIQIISPFLGHPINGNVDSMETSYESSTTAGDMEGSNQDLLNYVGHRPNVESRPPSAMDISNEDTQDQLVHSRSAFLCNAMSIDEDNVELLYEDNHDEDDHNTSSPFGFSAAIGNAEEPTEELITVMGLCNRRIHYG